MKSTHYMFHFSYGTKPMNKLQEDCFSNLKQLDRMMVDANDLPKLKANILEVISKLNTKYPRCKPVKASWSELERIPGIETMYLSLDGQTFVVCKIYGARRVEL